MLQALSASARMLLKAINCVVELLQNTKLGMQLITQCLEHALVGKRM